ncbi:TVP38/TMEM64 family protein [Pseudanabaena biceps]|nr:TVP38/TMEM64 family protein [Pseudanabaena biceps]
MKKKILVVVAIILTIITGWITFIHIDWFSQIQQIVKTSGIWGSVIFVIAYAIATLLILPVTALNIAGGALYGGFEGLLLTSAGALTSAFMGFVLARWLGNKWIPSDKSESNISKNLVSGGIGYAFAARLFPLIPYGLVSFAAGLSPIKHRDYLIGTLLGTPLGIAPFVLLGSTGVQVTSSHDVRPLLASSLGLAILVVVGTWYGSSQKEELTQEDYAEAKK